MFDLRKIFDLKKIFAVPKDFLKSKIYCTKISWNNSTPNFAIHAQVCVPFWLGAYYTLCWQTVYELLSCKFRRCDFGSRDFVSWDI